MKLALMMIIGLGLSMSSVAGGKLHVFGWGGYTPPELLERFSQTFDVEVTLDLYDSNEAMLAKIEAGGSGYDIAIPSDYIVPVMIEKDLLLETRPNEMTNFKQVNKDFADVYWDPGRNYSVPWGWGSTGISVNTDYYDPGHEPNDKWSWSILFDPPAALRGKINMLPEMTDVIAAGLFYLGKPQCNSNKEDLKALNELLLNAKQHWRTIGYDTGEKLIGKDVYASHNWTGTALRARLQRPELVYIYPKEGLMAWAESVVVLKDAPNAENAKLFQNFMMAPENAVLIALVTRNAISIDGTEQYMDEVMTSAPEIVPPKGTPKPTFIPACPKEVISVYSKIWTNLLK